MLEIFAQYGHWQAAVTASTHQMLNFTPRIYSPSSKGTLMWSTLMADKVWPTSGFLVNPMCVEQLWMSIKTRLLFQWLFYGCFMGQFWNGKVCVGPLCHFTWQLSSAVDGLVLNHQKQPQTQRTLKDADRNVFVVEVYIKNSKPYHKLFTCSCNWGIHPSHCMYLTPDGAWCS